MGCEKLLLRIARCPRFFRILESNDDYLSCCEKVVNSQEKQLGIKDISDFQLPEPWNGDIVRAPILVVSSNPSISKEELYPTKDWPDEVIIDFFVNRFKDRGEKYSWVYNNRVLNKDGSRGKTVRYWTSIKNRVKELISKEPIPGIDYCITELVHCKSQKQEGVMGAFGFCAELYFNRIVRAGNFKLIMAIGSVVREYFNCRPSIYGIPVIYLRHPNAFAKKTEDVCGNPQVKKIKERLSAYFAGSGAGSLCPDKDETDRDKLVRDFIDSVVYSPRR